MRKPAAVVGSALFFLVAPATFGGLVPWLLTKWQIRPLPEAISWLTVPVRVVGVLLTLAGAVVLVAAFVRFVLEGRGTPAPVAPPTHLVVGGFYRYVRNPMYVALLAALLGQSLLFWQASLLVYAVVAWAATFAFVRFYEEPHLAKTFGAEYDEYRGAVPGWWPRLSPWTPPTA